LIDVVKTNFFTIVLLTIFTNVIQYYINYFNRPSKIPGPLPLPIIGNLHQFDANFTVSLKRFHEKYGDFYEFYMGSAHNIVISRPDLAEKLFRPASLKNTKFILRTSYSEGLNELDVGTKGMVFNRNIEDWVLNRRFMNIISKPSFLRESINLSNKVIDQVFEYWKIIEKEGMQIDVCEWLNTVGADIVSTTATGKSMAAATKLFNSLNIENKKSLQGIWENG
ncbi:34466_t:CDS:1, partial [Racocetra persica]